MKIFETSLACAVYLNVGEYINIVIYLKSSRNIDETNRKQSTADLLHFCKYYLLNNRRFLLSLYSYLFITCLKRDRIESNFPIEFSISSIFKFNGFFFYSY